MNNFAKV